MIFGTKCQSSYWMLCWCVCFCFVTETSQQQHHQITVNVDRVSVPLSRVLLPGQTTLDPSARCYIRYKFCDRGQFTEASLYPLFISFLAMHSGIHFRSCSAFPKLCPNPQSTPEDKWSLQSFSVLLLISIDSLGDPLLLAGLSRGSGGSNWLNWGQSPFEMNSAEGKIIKIFQIHATV